MKLYRVEFNIESVVAAENEEESFKIAYQNQRDMLTETTEYPDVGREITTADDLPSGWTPDSIPYGKDQYIYTTIEEILNKEK